jgi:hypothetical protein
MKYETPKLMALVPAINAVQQTLSAKGTSGKEDSIVPAKETNLAYQDWED